MPEERLESEKQVRRMLNVSGPGDPGSAGEVLDEKGGFSGRDIPTLERHGDEASNVCFESFAATKARGRQGLGGSREGTKTAKQRISDGNASQESIGEPVSVSLVVKGEHANASSLQHQEQDSIATVAIMSEPVLAAVETTPPAPSLGHQGECPRVSAAHLSAQELPIPNGAAIDSAHEAPSAISVMGIPELCSESTALCEVEINPPPVELPVNEKGWSACIKSSSLAIQSLVELPTYEVSGISPGYGSRITGTETNSCAPLTSAEDHAVTSDAGPRKTAKIGGHDRAGLPSQASRTSFKIPYERTSPRDRVSSTLDEKRSSRGTDQPVEMTGTEGRDMTHFPSILRPGPRRSRQPSLQQPGPVMPARSTYTCHAGGVQSQWQQEQQQKKEVETGSMSQGEPVRMPAMPPAPHPHELQPPASTTGPEVPPHADGPRQNRLPGSVNFVIPIQHISSAEPSFAPDRAETTGSPKYRVSATFASMKPSGEPPRARSETSGACPGPLPCRKTESWGRPGDEAASLARLVNDRTAAEVPEWSWGYAR